MSGVPGKYATPQEWNWHSILTSMLLLRKRDLRNEEKLWRREKKRNIKETGKRKWKKEDKRKDALRIITVNHIMDRDKVQVTEASRHQRWLIEVVEIRKRPQRTWTGTKGCNCWHTAGGAILKCVKSEGVSITTDTSPLFWVFWVRNMSWCWKYKMSWCWKYMSVSCTKKQKQKQKNNAENWS